MVANTFGVSAGVNIRKKTVTMVYVISRSVINFLKETEKSIGSNIVASCKDTMKTEGCERERKR